jgi:hypothetical protein
MRRWLPVVSLSLAIAVAAPSTASTMRTAAHTKAQAEVNVLRVLSRKWKAWRNFGLVDRRTHLVVDNTEAVCHGRRGRRAGNRYSRFVCVVRPHVHHGRQGLWLRYRVLSKGRSNIRFLAYRRR